MQATCLVCRDKFEFTKGKRTCGKHNSKVWYRKEGNVAKYKTHYLFWVYMTTIRKKFFNPVYQYKMLEGQEVLAENVMEING